MQQQPPDQRQTESQKPAVEHVTEAHRLLKKLRKRVTAEPELEQAIEQLEMALSILAVKTSGLL